jgi:hypothetical protein
MKLKDLTDANYTYTHEIEWVLEDNYSVGITVMFHSYEIAYALRTDGLFNWLPEYDEMEEKDFVLKFEDDFMSLNSQWINERAWATPGSNKAVYGGN